MVAVLTVALGANACTSDHFDRAAAIQKVIDDSGDRITAAQAGCYVDRVRDEIGTAPLRPGATVPPEQIARLTTIRVDCIGVANLGDEPTTDTVGASTGRPPGPYSRGDDAQLDGLWDRCAAGFGSACDELFDRAPLGSDYESFAATCGGRTRESRCADVYPAPGVSVPSPAQPSTTVPPPSP